MKSFDCAICRVTVEYDGSLPSVYPFCSPRCKMVDLGNWLLGKYAIERDATDEDAPQLAAAPPRGEKRAGQKGPDAERD
jgi:endogenous inhibitor of DNA gyrase (YacG/DUF329 family)